MDEQREKTDKELFKFHLSKKMAKLKDFIECDSGSSDEDDSCFENVDGFKIFKSLWDQLYQHQQDGVKWLWKLFCKKEGGILGDDMGLGKTIQIIALLSGLFDGHLIRHVIIVMPVSLLPNWKKEFEKWAPGISVYEYHGPKVKREKKLVKLQRKTGVLLTTYGMVVSSWERMGVYEEKKFVWDYIILDEGQQIKNATKRSKCVRAVPAKYHLILSGTPIQNNLGELWSLINFTSRGRLLGDLKTFKTEFENPIVRARERDATNYEKQMGNEISETLRITIAPYFLRRTKNEVFGKKEEENPEAVDGIEKPMSIENTPYKKNEVHLTKKHDFICWLFLSEIQLRIYEDFLNLDSVKEAIYSTRSPLADLTMLKKIADHPRLLSSVFCKHLDIDADTQQSEDVLLSESSKLIFTLRLVKNLKLNGHRTLIFSQSRKMLDIVDKVLTREGIKLMRFDGRITDPAERQKLINEFHNDTTYSCCLLTTQVGSVGLNMTAADRVIIFDPSWNPGNDAQAVDRAYRIGQVKDVIIYRLVTCGTIEEKILRKQIFKNAISKQATGTSKNPYRYFARHELRELFILEDPKQSLTHDILEELHGGKTLDPTIEKHYDFLKSLDIYGISDHGLVYLTEAKNHDEHQAGGDFALQIQERVRRAQEIALSKTFAEISIEPNSAKVKQGNHVKKQNDLRKQDDIILIDDSPAMKPEMKNVYFAEASKISVTSIHDHSSEDEIYSRQMVSSMSPVVAKAYQAHSPSYSNNLEDHSLSTSCDDHIISQSSFADCPISPKNDNINTSQISSGLSPKNTICRSSSRSSKGRSHQSASFTSTSIASTQSFTEVHPEFITSSAELHDAFKDEEILQNGHKHNISISKSNINMTKSDVMVNDSPSNVNVCNIIVNESPIALDASYPGITEPDAIVNESDEVINASFASNAIIDDSMDACTATSSKTDCNVSATDAIVDESVVDPDALNTDVIESSFDVHKTNGNIEEFRTTVDQIVDVNLQHEAISECPLQESSIIEVIDRGCSPFQIVSPSIDERNSIEGMLIESTSISADSANDESITVNSFVDVVDIACSPINLQPNKQETSNNLVLSEVASTESITPQSNDNSIDVPSLLCPISSCSTKGTDSFVSNTMAATSEKSDKASSQFGLSQSLLSNSAVTDEYKSDSQLGSSLPTQPVPESLDHLSAPSDSSCSFIPDPGAQEADTVLLNRTSNLFVSPLKYTERNIDITRDGEIDLHRSRVNKLICSANRTQPHTLEHEFAHRSVKIVESESDQDFFDEDNSDHEVIMKKHRGYSHSELNGSDTYFDDDDDDDDGCANDNDSDGSVSSNEQQMISILSTGRMSSSYREFGIVNHDVDDFLPVASNIVGDDNVDDDSDNTNSDDELLVRSRRSLRKSIMSKPRSSPKPCSELPSLQRSHSSSLTNDEQDRDTLQISEPESLSPLVVWDEPFYKRAPGKQTDYSTESTRNLQMADTVLVQNESVRQDVSNRVLQDSQENILFECPNNEHKLMNIAITSCECVLNAEDRNHYHSFIRNAEQQITEGHEMIAIENYLKALKIADFDPKIQQAAFALVKKFCSSSSNYQNR